MTYALAVNNHHVLWLLVLLSCTEKRDLPPQIDEQQAELQALGYLEYSPNKADTTRMGVTRLNSDLAQPGYTMITLMSSCTAQLLDMQGTVVHAWHESGCAKWSHTELLDNGDILVPGIDEVRIPGRSFDQRRYLLRMAWDGGIIWKRRVPAHHQAIATPDGSVVALALQDRRLPDARHSVQDNLLSKLSAQGATRDQLSLYQSLKREPGVFTFRQVAPTHGHGRRYIDLFHANSVAMMTSAELTSRHPLYAVGNILVSIRHQDAVAILDPNTRRVVWSWGQGVLSGPHDATILANGHLLIFDNGLARGWSRVIELDPVSNKIIWSWRASAPERFFTAGRGSSQRLQNGNTLLAESGRGRVIEVTPKGEIVWEYWVPHLNAKGHRATIVRARRFDTQQIDRLRAH